MSRAVQSAAGENLPDAVSRLVARELWQRLETLHAVTYFAPESRSAANDVGLKGFWMGYFGFRAAPLGPASASTVQATFANFAPSMVHRSVPDVWHFASPEGLLDARAASAATALRRLCPDIETLAANCIEPLTLMMHGGDTLARPLFAANLDVEPFADPVAQLWQLATTFREHRGDGHNAALAASNLTGLEAHVLHQSESGAPPELLRDNRGYSFEDWNVAALRLAERGLLDGDRLTVQGAALRHHVETTTDALSARMIGDSVGIATTHSLIEALTPAALAVAASGVIPFPNPMGLDQVD